MGTAGNVASREPWNKGKPVGQKAPFKLKDIYALRVLLQMEQRVRELARKDGGPTLDDAFEIGSISKTMTAFLVADLIAAGTWTLDDPIEKHLPPGTRVPSQGDRKILVRDLLTHSSALPRLPRNFIPGNASDPYSDMTEKDLLRGLAATRLHGAIGNQAVCSNFGMMVLSVAVARAHRADFDGDFERVPTERLFKPLKMDGAFVARQPAGMRLAPGHLWTGEITPHWTLPRHRMQPV